MSYFTNDNYSNIRQDIFDSLYPDGRGYGSYAKEIVAQVKSMSDDDVIKWYENNHIPNFFNFKITSRLGIEDEPLNFDGLNHAMKYLSYKDRDKFHELLERKRNEIDYFLPHIYDARMNVIDYDEENL